MTSNLYIRPTLTATARGTIDPQGLVARWERELRDSVPSEIPADNLRRVALHGRIARATPGLLPDPHITVSESTIAFLGDNLAKWRERFLHALDDFLDMKKMIEELDSFELVWAVAERAGIAPAELRISLDECVDLLVASAPELLGASEYVQTVAATFSPNLATENPILARTTEKFVVLLDVMDATERDEAPLPALRVPPVEPAPPTPAQPGRIPALPVGFPLAAGASIELPAVAPYEWRNTQKGKTKHVATLVVPQVPPQSRELKLLVDPEYVGRPVLLGGLRGKVDANGVATFDWDDVVAVGMLVEHLVIGSGPPWELLDEDRG
jgi:hypothetical protein